MSKEEPIFISRLFDPIFAAPIEYSRNEQARLKAEELRKLMSEAASSSVPTIEEHSDTLVENQGEEGLNA